MATATQQQGAWASALASVSHEHNTPPHHTHPLRALPDHRFTLVNQASPDDPAASLTKGRTREAGAVKISCARQDPNARNCHGYRKFVKRSILEDPLR